MGGGGGGRGGSGRCVVLAAHTNVREGQVGANDES